VAEQPQKERKNYPEVIHMIRQNTFDVIDILIFVNHPENKDAQQKKSGKFEGFDES